MVYGTRASEGEIFKELRALMLELLQQHNAHAPCVTSLSASNVLDIV